MHHDERRLGSIAQAQQGLAQRRHGARVVFILIVSGVKRVQDDDFGGGSLSGGEEVIQSLRRAEQMAGGVGVDQEVEIGGGAHARHMTARRPTNCGTGSSNWQIKTRRGAGMENPMRPVPAASERARVATNKDLPTLGSPPTKRMPC